MLSTSWFVCVVVPIYVGSLQHMFAAGDSVIIRNDTNVTLPAGPHRVRVLLVGAGGSGCAEHKWGRGKRGHVETEVFSARGPETIHVRVGRGGLSPNETRGQSTIFGEYLKADGGHACGSADSNNSRITGLNYFLSNITQGFSGVNAGDELHVWGGEGGILINGTGPSAQDGGGNYSSEGGHGYGAGGGSGGVARGANVRAAFGGAGAPGVAYVEILPPGPCRGPDDHYMLLAMEANRDPKKIKEQLNIVLRMSQMLNLNKTTFGLILYKGVPELKFRYTPFSDLKSLRSSLSLYEYEENISAPVNFASLYVRAIEDFSHHSLPRCTRKYFFITTYGGKVKDKRTLEAYRNALCDEKKVVPVAAVITENASYFPESELLVKNRKYLFKNTSRAIYQAIPEVIKSLLTVTVTQTPTAVLPTPTSKPTGTNITVTKAPINIEFPPLAAKSTAFPKSTVGPPDSGSTGKQSQELRAFLKFDVDTLNVANEDGIQKFMNLAGEVLSGIKGSDAFQVITIIEKASLFIAEQLKPKQDGYDSLSFQAEDQELSLAAYAVNLTNMPELNLRRMLRSSSRQAMMGQHGVALPNEAVLVDGADKGRIVWLVYRPPDVMNGSRDSPVDSRVMNVIAQPQSTSTFGSPVKLVFRVSQERPNTTDECVFWKKNISREGNETGYWSTEGCWVASRDVTTVTCHCNHLTSFSVLTKVQIFEPSQGHQLTLSVISSIGCAISIVGCIMTIFVFFYLPSLRSQRTLIHLNLVLAILLTQVVFLLVAFAVKPETSEVACFALAVVLCYFSLCVFFWMVSEGIHIYFMVIRVFNTERATKKRYYYIIGWVIPVLITVASAAAFQQNFVSDEICWLSVESGAIWAFVGPAIGVMLVNLFILVRVLKVTANMLQDECPSSTRALLKAFVTLLPILGLTWVFGFLAVSQEMIVFDYLFTIFSSIQGFLIFLLYCLGSSEVRREFKRKLRNKKARRNPSNSTGSKPRSHTLKVLLSNKDKSHRSDKFETEDI